MNRWIVLLRGVTPTGKNRVPMAALREVLSNDGFKQVRSWIQSGNLLVDTPLDRQQTHVRIEGLLAGQMGVSLAVIIKTVQEIEDILAHMPFDGLDLARVFYGLFNDKPASDKVRATSAIDLGEDRLIITDEALYAFIPGSAAKSKLNNATLQRKLGITLTLRNRNTLTKLVEMAHEDEPVKGV